MSGWQETIDRNLNEPSQVEFSLAVKYVLSDAFTGLLHNDIDASCSKWERYQAREGMYSLTPNKPGLYMFVWAPTSLSLATDQAPLTFRIPIYIGKAEVSLQDRLKSEYNSLLRDAKPEAFWSEEQATRKTRLLKYFSLTPLEYWCCISETPQVLPNLEGRLLRLFNPPANKQRKLRAIAPPQQIWRS